jgi:histidine triad (HIT) family protein
MIVPKEHIPSTAQLKHEHAALMGRIILLAPKLAQEQGCAPYPEGGWRIAINTGAHGGQHVHHLHVHVLGGPRPWQWG